MLKVEATNGDSWQIRADAEGNERLKKAASQAGILIPEFIRQGIEAHTEATLKAEQPQQP